MIFCVLPGDQSVAKRMRLRYAGHCRACGSSIGAREWALYDRSTKTVECEACASEAEIPDELEVVIDDPNQIALDMPVVPVVEAGVAGESARREYERRAANREGRMRKRHPMIGGFLLAVTEEPQSTTAWARGAVGEERLGARLDKLSDEGVLLLHDRRIPGSRANIDHIAVSSAGVFVIDAKHYKGRPELRVRGGFLSPRVESLLVGRRDCTSLVDGVIKQAHLVRAVLSADPTYAEVPLHAALCFVEADWPLIGGSFRTRGVDVVWPRKIADDIRGRGSIDAASVSSIHRLLATSFPRA